MTEQENNQESPDQITEEVHGGARSRIPNPPPVGDSNGEVQQGTDGHTEEGGGKPRLNIPGRPEGLPENFNSVEDLAAAFKETQRKLTEATQGKAKETEGQEQGQEQQNAPAEPTLSDVMDAAEQEYATTGDISATTRVKLEAMGLSSARIDGFIQGVEARGREELKRLHDAAGGEALMQTMFAWAEQNLKESELIAMNASLDAGGTLAVQAVQALSNVYHASEGKVPTLLRASTSNNVEGMDVYPAGETGRRMMIADMKKPEYRDPNDPTFRNKVDAKIERSKL